MIRLVYAYESNTYRFGLNEPNQDGTYLPWPKISRDFENFKNSTKDFNLIMGAKTFSTLPKCLPGRRNIVVVDPSREIPIALNGDYPDYTITKDQFIQGFENNKDQDFAVIGGIEILKMALPYADEIHVSTIKYYPWLLQDPKAYRGEGVNIPDELQLFNLLENRFKIAESHTWNNLHTGTSLGLNILKRV